MVNSILQDNADLVHFFFKLKKQKVTQRAQSKTGFAIAMTVHRHLFVEYRWWTALGLVFAEAATVAEQPNYCVIVSATVHIRHRGRGSAQGHALLLFVSSSQHRESLLQLSSSRPCDPEQFPPSCWGWVHSCFYILWLLLKLVLINKTVTGGALA